MIKVYLFSKTNIFFNKLSNCVFFIGDIDFEIYYNHIYIIDVLIDYILIIKTNKKKYYFYLKKAFIEFNVNILNILTDDFLNFKYFKKDKILFKINEIKNLIKYNKNLCDIKLYKKLNIYNKYLFFIKSSKLEK